MTRRTLARPLHPATAHQGSHPIAHAPTPHHVLNGRQFVGLSETTARTPTHLKKPPIHKQA